VAVVPAVRAAPGAEGAGPVPPGAPAAAAEWGAIDGIVRYDGAAPLRVRELTNAIDVPTCGARVKLETIVTGPGTTLGNVFVEILAADDTPACAFLAADPPDAPPHVEIVRCQHDPHVVVVPLGRSVDVRNVDGILHELVAVPVRNPPLTLRLPRYRRHVVVPEGALRRPEVLKVSCDTHPFMVGWWIVTGNGCSTLTSADGRFAIERVPPGLWRVRAWHEDLGVVEEEVRVDASGVAQAELVYR
jgi:hypothetical protein